MAKVKTTQQINQLVKDAQDLTDVEVEKFIRNLKKFLDNALEEIVGELGDGNIEPASALGGLLDAIKKKGLRKELGELSAIYGKELKQVQRNYKAVGIKESIKNVTPDALTALIKFKVEDIENKSLAVIGELRPKIMESILLDQKIDLSGLKETLASRLFNQVKTEVRTAVMTFNRTVTVSQAQRLGYDRFVYSGPDDKITRDFCSDLLNDRNPPIYTQAEIEEMDNDQGLDVFTSGGGYNCRHDWIPVSEDLEAKLVARAEEDSENDDDDQE